MKFQFCLSLLFLASPSIRAAAVPASLEVRDADTTTNGYGTSKAQVEVIYEFPLPTWVENLVVRPSGQILATLLSKPELWQVDPVKKTAQLVYSFPGFNGLVGITGVGDTYYLVTGIWNSTTLALAPYQFGIWQVQMTPGSATPAKVRKVADLNAAVFLNGIEIISQNPDVLLVADSSAGVVFRVNVATGASTVVLDDSLLKPNQNFFSGVNGLKYDGSKYLYFSNSAQALLGRVAIDTNGNAIGPFQTVTTNAATDDFVLKPGGGAYLCLGLTNQLAVTGPNYGPDTVLVDSLNTTELLGPTAARLGRTPFDAQAVYVSSSGGLRAWQTKNFTVSGRITRVWPSKIGY